MRLTGRVDMTGHLVAAVSRKLRCHAAHVATQAQPVNTLHACPEWAAGLKLPDAPELL